jgi:hypothetical protein
MNVFLVFGGGLSALASLAHIAVIFGGASWYRFFGAGEGMARMAERHMWQPTLITIGIAGVLMVWGLYGFAGGGVIRKLPLMRLCLVGISSVYLLRAVLFVPALMMTQQAVTPFAIWSSLIVLLYGICYAIGTFQVWKSL